MNAHELADELNACFTKADWEYVDYAVSMLRQQADRIAELEKEKIRAYDNGYEDGRKPNTTPHDKADRITEFEFENKAFRDELFKRESMDSCSQAVALHGFISPRQAGDDAREYIANILKKAMKK